MIVFENQLPTRQNHRTPGEEICKLCDKNMTTKRHLRCMIKDNQTIRRKSVHHTQNHCRIERSVSVCFHSCYENSRKIWAHNEHGAIKWRRWRNIALCSYHCVAMTNVGQRSEGGTKNSHNTEWRTTSKTHSKVVGGANSKHCICIFRGQIIDATTGYLLN